MVGVTGLPNGEMTLAAARNGDRLSVLLRPSSLNDERRVASASSVLRSIPATWTITTALSAPVDSGGWGGIRTHETVARLPVFKTGAFNRSATHPAHRRLITSRANLGCLILTFFFGASEGVRRAQALYLIRRGTLRPGGNEIY